MTNKPQIHRLWKRGFNCARGGWRLFVYKSDYNKLLNENQRLTEDREALAKQLSKRR